MQSLSSNAELASKNEVIPSRNCSNRSRSPRLPTPETSRSSYDASESERMPNSARRSTFEQKPYVRSVPERDYGSHYNAAAKSSSRRNSRTRLVPHSPPYDEYDRQRPSLPPLKTVFGDNLCSPPRTPTVGETPLQPLPREPRYTVDTYKPPSLYPNKKQRRESGVETAPSLNSCVSLASPGMQSTIVDTNQSSVANSNMALPPPPTGYSLPIPRHQSVQGILYQARTPTQSHYATEAPVAADNSQQQQSFGVARPFNKAEQSPAGPSSEFHFRRTRSNDHDVPEFKSRFREPVLQSPDRPLPQQSWAGEQARNIEHYHTIDTAYQRDNRYPPRPDHENGQVFSILERDQHPPSPRSGFMRTYVQSSQPTVWVPAMNDPQGQRSKKRSNLPKNSTEIMRRWFDQNISNPYPTEEQKAVFSNHTGISMTQVSNWFINHRRRCPELRDRREKNRDRVARQCGQYED